MIRLEVEDYCQDCDEFKPAAEVIESYSIAIEGKRCLTCVRCKHEHRCREMIRYLKKKVK